MQHSVDTVDPNLLDLRHFPQLSASGVVEYQYDADKSQWTDKSAGDEDTVPNVPVQDSRRSPDDQLEFLGPFEFGLAYEPDHTLKTWDDTTSTCDSGVREKFFEDLQSRDDFGPWNHLQSLDSASLKRSHSYLSSDLSSGVPSTTETLGWPGTSPPDSGPAFVTSENTLETQHSEYADACTPINLGVQSYVTNHERHPNPAFHSGSPITYARTIQNNQFYGVAERCSGSNDTDYDIYDPHLETSSSHQPDEPVSPQQHGALPVYPIHPLSDKYDGTTACQLNEPTPYHEDPLSEYAGFTHPQTATISIEGTSERFQSDTASSFPPTAGFFPEYWPVSAKEGIRPKARPASRSFALRPASRNSRGNKKPSVPLTEPSLSVIHEDGKGGVASSSQTTKKGRRAGPLSRVKAAQAAKNRKEKSVCIRCKMMKQACSGEVPCLGCRENLGAKIWKSPCVKAEFLDLVEAGSCNYISQRSINHLTLDKSRRVTMILPTTFDLAELLDLLKPRLSCFNIHARQLTGPLYTLDLAKCYDFLTEIRKVHDSGKFELREFIDNKLLKASDWLKCVTEPCSITESLALLAKWNNMPSRASYDIVSLIEGVPSRPMDVENPEDKEEILIAAQLSRIVCRALEVAAFKYLQKELNNLTKGSKSNDGAEKFVRELGQLLLTLRWRISWWELLGDGSAIRDDSRDRYVDRVRSLTRVLYFYYCNAKKKLPSWMDPQSLKGVQSCYADAEPIFDDFPHTDSIDGFHDWMMHGQELITEAGVQRRLSRY